MTSLREDLERIAAGVRGVTKHPVEVVIEGTTRAVYVNFDYAQAVCIETELTPDGHTWSVAALAWDQTGGLSDERELGAGLPSSRVADVVRTFLEEQDANTARVEAMLADRPDD